MMLVLSNSTSYQPHHQLAKPCHQPLMLLYLPCLTWHNATVLCLLPFLTIYASSFIFIALYCINNIKSTLLYLLLFLSTCIASIVGLVACYSYYVMHFILDSSNNILRHQIHLCFTQCYLLISSSYQCLSLPPLSPPSLSYQIPLHQYLAKFTQNSHKNQHQSNHQLLHHVTFFTFISY